MFKAKNSEDNDDVIIKEQNGAFRAVEYKRDLSVDYEQTQSSYFASEMNVRRRQLVCDVSQSNIIVQAGTMQWMAGNINSTTGIKGAGDFFKKALCGPVTGESAVKPEYTSDGFLVLKPTYKHIILLDADDWNNEVIIEGELPLACDSELEHKAIMRSSILSAVVSGEGLFSPGFYGTGIVALESCVPREELIETTLDNDVLKIDGSAVIAWNGTLSFTVERAGKSLIGSTTSSEGFVNVYRGTGKVLMAPVSK